MPPEDPQDRCAETTWISAHVYRHCDRDVLLTRCVDPVVSDLAVRGVVRGFFFLRHWEAGPHVRLRVLTAARHAGEVREELERRLTDTMARFPSFELPAPAAYGVLAARAAALEDHPGYERRIQPTDTIRFVPYVPEHASFGYGPSLTAVERHFAASSRIALDVLPAGPERVEFHATAMTLSCYVGGPPGRVRRAVGAAARSDPRVDRVWRASGPELLRLARMLREARHTVHHATPEDAPVLHWLAAITALREELGELARAGRFAPAQPRPVAHAVSRCLHLHLNRLGVLPGAEALLRAVAARAARELAQEVPEPSGPPSDVPQVL